MTMMSITMTMRDDAVDGDDMMMSSKLVMTVTMLLVC